LRSWYREEGRSRSRKCCDGSTRRKCTGRRRTLIIKEGKRELSFLAKLMSDIIIERDIEAQISQTHKKKVLQVTDEDLIVAR